MVKDLIALFQRSSNLRSRLQSGVAWIFLATVCTQGSTFVVNLITSNLLGAVILGKFAIVQSTLMTISQLAQFATGYTSSKYIAELRSTDKMRAGRILGLCGLVSVFMGVVGALTLLFAAPWVARFTFGADHLTHELRIIAPTVLLSVLNGFLTGALAGLENYRGIGSSAVAGGVLSIFLYSLTVRPFGLVGALFSIQAGAFVQSCTLSYFFGRERRRQEIPLQFRDLQREKSIILNFALPAAISGFTTLPALWIANALLARHLGGTVEFGFYSAAYTLRTLVLFLPAIINTAGIPVLNNQLGLGDSVRYRKVFWANFVAMSGTALFVAAGVSLAGDLLLQLFGRDFQRARFLLIMLVGSAVLEVICMALYQVIQSRARMWLSFLVMALPRDFLIVFLAYYLIPTHGAYGLAWAYAGAWSISMLIYSSLVLRVGLHVEPTAGKSDNG